MTLISIEADKTSISKRFRKADYFAFLKDGKVNIIKNEHKTSKSNEFFEYFNTLGIERIYVKELGYKTFLKLQALKVAVYFVQDVEKFSDIETNNLLLLNEHNAEDLCTLGHHKPAT